MSYDTPEDTMDARIAAISTLTTLALRAFDLAARTDDRLVAARGRLGTDRFADVAAAALRGAMKRTFVDGAADRREELGVAGELAAKTAMLGVVAEAVSAVLAADGLESGAMVRAFGRREAEVVEVFDRRADGRTPVLVRYPDGVEAMPFADELETL